MAEATELHPPSLLIPSAQAPPLLVFADDWGRHPSSCQHLVRRLRRDFRVLWVNSIGTRQVRADSFTVRRGLEKLKNWGRGLRQVSEQMWVVDLPMLPSLAGRISRGINRRLVTSRLNPLLCRLGMSRPIVLTTLPYVGWLIRDMSRRGLVYYCTDDYSHWPSTDRESLLQADRALGDEADFIIAASRKLLERHEAIGRCRYFPHGVDYAHFASAQYPGIIAPALARLPRPRIGFFGLVYEKLDFELLGALAVRFKDGCLVMIGPVAHCPEDFKRIGNVHLLGKVEYEDLPRHLAGLDVLLLPYRDDAMIRQSGPLKLRECLASGKPTVSIDVPEVRTFQPHVRIAEDRAAFLYHVQQALEEPLDSPLAAARQMAVAHDGWDRRADLLRSLLDGLD